MRLFIFVLIFFWFFGAWPHMFNVPVEIEEAQAAAPAGLWWNANYQHRQKITLSAGSAAVPNGYSGSVTFNHASLVSAGKSQADGDDIRVLYWNGAMWVELDRVLGESSSWNNVSTQIWFKLQAAISASATDDNYYLYYGNSGAVSPPANRANVYLFENLYIDANPTNLPTNTANAIGAFDNLVGTHGGWGVGEPVSATLANTAQSANGFVSASVRYRERTTGSHSADLQYRVAAGAWNTVASGALPTTLTTSGWYNTPNVNSWSTVDSAEVRWSATGGSGNLEVDGAQLEVTYRTLISPEPSSSLGSEETGPAVNFTDITTSAGLSSISNTYGIAWGDYNNDGYPDLYVSGANALYTNDGDGTYSAGPVTDKNRHTPQN